LDELLTGVVKNTKHSSASANITRFKLCLGQNTQFILL